MSMTAQEFIAHVGVKGMKWGVRKRPDPNRSASKWKQRKDKEREDKAKAEKKTSAAKPKAGEPVVFNERAMGPVKKVQGDLFVEKGGKEPKPGFTLRDKGPDGKEREILIKEVDRIDATHYRVKGVRAMTESELKAEVSRMQLEKQYKDLTASTTPPKQLTRGQKFAKEAGSVGIKIVTKAVTDVGTQVVKSELQKQLGISIPDGGKKTNPVETPKSTGAAPKVPTTKPTLAGKPQSLGKIWKP